MREFNLDKIKATGTTVGDVYFPQTRLLLPFDGANTATTTSDLSNGNHSVTFNGNAQISTAQSKFGGSSCYFDGTGDYLSVPSSSDFVWAGAFTLECWVRFSSLSGSPYVTTSGTDDDYFHRIRYVSSGWNIAMLSTVLSGGTDSLSVDTWYHIALVRKSDNTTVFYRDGVSKATGTVSGTINNNNGLLFGKYSGGYYLNGYIDDVRVTQSLARYTSAFTPPSTAHLTSAGDVNKQIIINSAADGVAIGTGGINQARIAKAWVNFDADPSVSIRQSYNVSSITDTATGRFTINFSTAMLDADYCFSGSGGNQTGTTSGGRMVGPDGTKTTSALPVRYVTWGSTGTRNVYDNDYHCLIVFGN